MNKINVLLADDHTLIREGFKSLLGQNTHVVIVAEASNGIELLNLIPRIMPEVILVDITMPNMNGLEAIERISALYPGIKTIVLSMHEEREYVIRALQAGAKGYLLKNIEKAELQRAIKTVYEGGKYFSPAVTSMLAESVTKPQAAVTTDITPREKEVLILVASGNSSKHIADKLGISIRTVETHRINMLKKLNVANTAELITKSIQLNLLDQGQ